MWDRKRLVLKKYIAYYTLLNFAGTAYSIMTDVYFST